MKQRNQYGQPFDLAAMISRYPLPWIAVCRDDHDEWGWSVDDHAGQLVAESLTEETARLLVAAPRMLNALDGVLVCLPTIPLGSDMHQAIKDSRP